MKRRLFIMALAVISAVAFTSCSAEQKMAQEKKTYEVLAKQITTIEKPKLHFSDLSKGLLVNVITVQPKEEITIKPRIYHYSGKNLFQTSIAEYVRSMGLSEMFAYSDLILNIKLIRADMSQDYQNMSEVEMEVSLTDSNGVVLFTQNHIKASEQCTGRLGINRAYTQALEQINWNRIATFLRTEQLPKDEPNKQVQGLGDTALEQTIIRWDIQSRPQGADVFWRVVSKTPEVKSTNNKYLQTTPYEATKALDIKGLTYQTSGNVRIILRCEKDGYMSQEKEFDVRMVLDQEEISAFFRLVKEE